MNAMDEPSGDQLGSIPGSSSDVKARRPVPSGRMMKIFARVNKPCRSYAIHAPSGDH